MLRRVWNGNVAYICSLKHFMSLVPRLEKKKKKKGSRRWMSGCQNRWMTVRKWSHCRAGSTAGKIKKGSKFHFTSFFLDEISRSAKRKFIICLSREHFQIQPVFLHISKDVYLKLFHFKKISNRPVAERSRPEFLKLFHSRSTFKIGISTRSTQFLSRSYLQYFVNRTTK